MPATATLYLEMNADRMRAGKAQADAILGGIQTKAAAATRSMAELSRSATVSLDRAAQSNRNFALTLDKLPAGFVAVSDGLVEMGEKASVAGEFMEKVGHKLTNVGAYASSFARHLKGMLIIAPTFEVIHLALGLVEDGIKSLFEPTEEETKRMEALKKATQNTTDALTDLGKARALTQANQADYGNSRGGLGEQIAAVDKLRKQLIEGDAASTGMVDQLSNLGVKLKDIPAGAAAFKDLDERTAAWRKNIEGAGHSVEEAPFHREWQQAPTLNVTNEALKQAADAQIKSLEDQKKAEDDAADATKRQKDAIDKSSGSMHVWTDKLETFLSLPKGVQGSYLVSQAKGAFGGSDKPLTDWQKLSSAEQNAKLKAESDAARNRLHEQQLADIEQAQRETEMKRKAAADKAAAKAEADFNRSASGFASGFESASQNLLTGMSTLGGAFTSFAESVANQVLQQTVTKPAGEAVGSGLASFFSSDSGDAGAASGGGSWGSAKGNVFGRRGLMRQFAGGGIFGQPTLFGYGAGNLGIMGEAGPEAVMPLKRGADGKLGVQSRGGAQSTVINVNVSGVQDSKGMRQSAKQVAKSVDRSISRR